MNPVKVVLSGSAIALLTLWAPGVALAHPRGEWCSDEGGVCNVPPGRVGSISYGAGERWISRPVNGPTPCSNDVFGDPFRGRTKHCFLRLEGTYAPPPVVYAPPPPVYAPPPVVYAPPPVVEAPPVYVEAAPPPPVVEQRAPPPGRDYEWAPGYWRWEGGRHVWIAGHWEGRRVGYHWAAHHWENRGGRWVFIEGGWRR